VNVGEIQSSIQEGLGELAALRESLDKVGADITQIWGRSEELVLNLPESGEANEAVGILAEMDQQITDLKGLAAQAEAKFDEM
jgi:hypothetical protein